MDLRGQQRFLSLAGAANVRDLGGLPIAAGGTTRRGRILRSDLLVRLDSGDEDALVDRYGLRTVVDLRTTEELRRCPGPWEGHGVRAVSAPLPLDPAFAAGRSEDLTDLYLSFLEPPATAMVKAVATVMTSTDQPLLVHCAAGKDRTGVLVALLLEIIGVERAAVIDDYVMTHDRMPAVIARLEAEAGRLPGHRSGAIHGADPGTLETFLTEADERFGGGRGWALARGLGEELLESFAASMTASTR